MLVLTWTLSRRKVRLIAKRIVQEHEQAINELQQNQVIRLQFQDELLQQAEFLLNLQKR